MIEPFRFSEDDWKRISEPLQSRLGLTVQDDYCVPVRHFLEDVIDYWRLSDADVCEQNEAACEEILQAIANLRATNELDVGRRLIDSQFLQSLDALEKKCSDFLENAETRLTRNGRQTRNGRRDLLIEMLLVVWKANGGEAKTSTALSDGLETPAGPLIRFLIAVTDLVGIGLSPHAARKLIRNYRATDVAQSCS